MKGLLIESVVPGSIAAEIGIEAGDTLIAINGHTLRDIIDYSFYAGFDEELLLEVLGSDGELWEYEIEREPGEPLGLSFPPPVPAKCRNNCLFCFVHQLPKGLRKPLYVKDEDYRLSFLNGNYVTLANLKSSELKRITEQRLSPLYISVHATSPKLREKLLGRIGIPPIMEQLRKLAKARISMHTQIVLCPELNDGEELERTVADLASLYPAVQSLAIVPLGLTEHRRNLPALKAVDSDYARAFVQQWGAKSIELRKQLGEPFLFISDEFYLKGGVPFPPLREYGDLPQIENGVGMVPLFLRDAARVIRSAGKLRNFKVSVVSGRSAIGFVSDFTAALSEKSGVEIVPIAVENRLFGCSVTVSGLISGRDILAALEGVDTGMALFVPDVMLKEGEGVFLDDLPVEELEKRLGRRVILFDSSPRGFYNCLKKLSQSNKINQEV